jgi:hypothetical protein
MAAVEGPAARILVPDGTCITLKCGERVFEVCAGDREPKVISEPVDPGGIAAVRELKGTVDLHDLDVDWTDRDEVTTFRASD